MNPVPCFPRMNRLAWGLALLTLAACASEPEAPVAQSPSPLPTFETYTPPVEEPEEEPEEEPIESDGDGAGGGAGGGGGNRAPKCDRNTLDCVERLGKYLAQRAGYSGMAARGFTLAYQICSIYPVSAVARQYDSANDPVSAAEAYAAETFVDAVQPAGFNGCLSGFQDEP
jgi:hypothetical protein